MKIQNLYSNLRDRFGILFWKLAKRILIRDYGCRCKPEDYEEDCVECEAGRVVRFIDKHIDLTRHFMD